ncbi:MAG: succinate dehydrogenase, hydrophobic membrane anchor protein [Burkholderiaceae bacterium]|jgi:succinate dehydrogenase / fumarate reductase membrane anchor subunit|nr:succinate dehydrogenase, hydrophobic membrane anchor protein [Burkholderiaceae bacterium]
MSLNTVNYGSRRTVIGAHYGLRDWLVQRVTAALMALFTLLLLAQVVFIAGPVGYRQWAGIFGNPWMRGLSFAVILALAWHVWVGVRDVWMDYARNVWMRLLLEVLSIVWLAGCVGWAVQALWRL